MSRSAIGILAASCLAVGAGATYLVNVQAPGTQALTPTVDASSTPAPSTQTAANGTGAGASTAAPAVTAPAASLRRPAPAVVTNRPAPTSRAQARPVAPEASAAPSGAAAVVDRIEPTPASAAPLPSAEPEVAVAEPTGPRFEDLVVSTDSVLGLQLETTVSSETARVEDEVVARVTRDVRVGGRVAIPSGSRVRGEVSSVERGGKLRERARLGIRFTSVALPDGTRVALETESIFRDGDAPGRESAAKIGGGALGGAIIGGIFGGKKGAIIGATTGAGAGTATVLAGGRNPAVFSAGTPVTVRLAQPATITVEER